MDNIIRLSVHQSFIEITVNIAIWCPSRILFLCAVTFLNEMIKIFDRVVCLIILPSVLRIDNIMLKV